MELDLQVSSEEIMSREVELGCESWISFASSCSSTAVQRTLSLRLCPNTAVETAIAQCTSRWAMARGHRLNTSIIQAAVHGLSGLFRAYPRSSLHSFVPFPPVPVPNKPPRFCGRKAKWSFNSSSTALESHQRDPRFLTPQCHIDRLQRMEGARRGWGGGERDHTNELSSERWFSSMLTYAHRHHRAYFLETGSPGRPPRLSHNS